MSTPPLPDIYISGYRRIRISEFHIVPVLNNRPLSLSSVCSMLPQNLSCPKELKTLYMIRSDGRFASSRDGKCGVLKWSFYIYSSYWLFYTNVIFCGFLQFLAHMCAKLII